MANPEEPLKPFYYTDQIPTEEQSPLFWQAITSPHLLHAFNFIIINEIRKYEVEALTPDACRVQLAKLKAFQEMLDLPRALVGKTEKEAETNEDLPPDH